MEWNTKTVGRCLTEYTKPGYDELVKNYTAFCVSGQDVDIYVNVSQATFVHSKPVCGYGELMYGVNEDGSLDLLKMIVDSSD
jgi:hypothetical protein